MIVNGCELVGISGGCISKDPVVLAQFDSYVSKIENFPKGTVWFDVEDQICFGSDLTYLNSQKQETPYLTDPDFFIKDSRYGLPYFDVYRSSGYKLSNLHIDSDIIVEKKEATSKYKNSSILIAGAGPSLDMVDLGAEDYDYLWVCNDFLKKEEIKNLEVSLYYMSSSTQSLTESKQYMLDNEKTIACFDINVTRNTGEIREYQGLFPKRTFLFSTRVFTTVGTMPRLINLAAHFEASEIKFVGMDGHPREHFDDGKSYSSFESGWKVIPDGQTFGSQRREYLLFWEYMKQKYPTVKFTNLGKIYEHNITSKILEFLP